MPRQDPAPTPRSALRRRFWRIFRLLVLFSLAIAGVAVAIVAQGEWRIHLLVATGLGVGFTVLVGTALMTLAFLSASSGHDDAAGEAHSRSDQKDE